MESEHNQEENKPTLKSRVKETFKKKYVRLLIGLTGGAFLGILYWVFIGCNGGSCPLSSNPYKTVLIFSIIGAFMNWNNKK